MVREMTFLMNILGSCLVGSDSQLSDTSHKPQHNLIVLGGSREKLYLGNHYFFFQCHFSGFEIKKYLSQRNHNETCKYQLRLIISYLNYRHLGLAVKFPVFFPTLIIWFSFSVLPPYCLIFLCLQYLLALAQFNFNVTNIFNGHSVKFENILLFVN